MSNQIKLSQEELQSLKSLQEKQNQLVVKFGQLEYEIQSLELQKETAIDQLNELKKEEELIGNQLTQKYGNGSIDVESGFFTKLE
jgi:uncharacterized protein YlxW (UPF0749 family)